ncbi:hypothetical protein D920_01834 [Enterococcus faecalis 13-SD-W-01]|nr:hypothetical protein D920_01834 [Enterococcus faecalis 13-SD-W-01]
MNRGPSCFFAKRTRIEKISWLQFSLKYPEILTTIIHYNRRLFLFNN